MEPGEKVWLLAGAHLQFKPKYLPPALEELLRVIRCNCKEVRGRKHRVSRKHSSDFSTACGQCQMLTCSNSSEFNLISDSPSECQDYLLKEDIIYILNDLQTQYDSSCGTLKGASWYFSIFSSSEQPRHFFLRSPFPTLFYG